MKPVYTKKGDAGFTSDLSGRRLAKDHPRIVLGGKIDSLQSAVDLALLGAAGSAWAALREVQRKLWQAAGELSGAGQACLPWPVTRADVDALEAFADSLGEPPKKFVRFDTPLAAAYNECRVRCRDLESACTALLRSGKLRPPVYAYLNRLSTVFFMLAYRESRRKP
ncbi:MAG: ATP:cob(I)alamin adenosyltransferase [Elusimicrobia bacterium]|nr:ATP:cob(I)alamin adenosyltransferase [Elusimicrobiota bacterium]